MTIELDEELSDTLVWYLEAHESDIANGINDFSELGSIFLHVLRREPEE